MGTGKFTLTPLPRNRAMVTPVSSEVVRVEPIRSRAPAARRSSPARTAPSHSPAFARAYNDFKRTPRERDVDVCAELFKFCKACEERFLETCGISCLFDVDSGAMPRATFQTLCTTIACGAPPALHLRSRCAIRSSRGSSPSPSGVFHRSSGRPRRADCRWCAN
jgi:hypothetical protein